MMPRGVNRLCANKSAQIKHEIETAGERPFVLGGPHQQFAAEQAVLAVGLLAGKIKLRGEKATRRRRDLHVEVARAALIDAGRDCAETVAPVRIGAHMATQAEAG